MKLPSHTITSRHAVRGGLRRRRTAALAILIFASTSVTLGAQGARPVAPFALADALSAARESHPLLRAAGGRREISVGTARQDAAMANPVFELRRENIGAPIAADVFATVSIGTDAFARRVALRRLVGAADARATADSAASARTVEFDIARAYWRAALALALRDAAGAQGRAFDSLAAMQARRAREGAIPEGAALRTRVEAERVWMAARTARADAERARGELARALAMPSETVPWPTERLDLPTLRNVSTSGRIDSVDARAALETARRMRPELVAARARVDEAQRREHAEALGALPAVGAIAGYKRTAGYNTGVAGVVIALPIFDRNQGARTRAHGERVAAEAELRALDAQVSAEVTAAERALAELTAAAPSRPLTDPMPLDATARDVAEVTALAYREGAATLLELLDAVRARWETRVAVLRWAADLRLARLDLDRATGASASDASSPPR